MKKIKILQKHGAWTGGVLGRLGQNTHKMAMYKEQSIDFTSLGCAAATLCQGVCRCCFFYAEMRLIKMAIVVSFFGLVFFNVCMGRCEMSLTGVKSTLGVKGQYYPRATRGRPSAGGPRGSSQALSERVMLQNGEE
jgi:hypothetical protein